MTQNQIAYHSMKETQRSNRAREIENERSNKAKEAENLRHNTETEKQTRWKDKHAHEIAFDELEEKKRSNKSQEVLKGISIGTDVIKHFLPSGNAVVGNASNIMGAIQGAAQLFF